MMKMTNDFIQSHGIFGARWRVAVRGNGAGGAKREGGKIDRRGLDR
jgi:hypothetical protein